MAGRNGGTPVNPGLIARLTQGVRYAITGVTPATFFSPGQPLQPQGPPDESGRIWDFPVGYNLNVTPRVNEPIGFATLRGLGDACELVRLAIETRKDQLCKLSWAVARTDGTDAGAAGKAVEAFLRYPDQDHDWGTWLRLLLEDLFVIDAPTIYRRTTKGGQLYALEIFDGATIKRIVDVHGRTPLPPDPAYQQIIKGMPAWDFSRDELMYVPRNPRPHKVYGFSQTEQVLLTVNTAIRRAVYQYNYYQEGNIPDALMGAPSGWTTTQIREFQQYWDIVMLDEDRLAQRRKMKMVPDGTAIKLTKTEPLFDEGDEWLARVVMFCFSLPATPFVKQMNRATAGAQQETAMQEGLLPLMAWLKGVMDRILQRWMGHPEFEWQWEDVQDIDPQVQAEIDDTNIKNRSRTINEVRAERGDPPVPWGDEPPAPGKPEPDPNPIDVGEDDSAKPDGVTEAAAEKAAGRSLQRGRRRRFAL